MSKVGVLQQVNGTTVFIDNVFYDGSEVSQYIPKQLGIQVEFNADDTNKLQFIKPVGGTFTPKKRGGYEKKNYSAYQNKPGFNNTRNESIVKQVIFKAAIEEHKLPQNSSKSLDEIYQELKSKYFSELK